jgi:hypothetical protein
VQQVESHLLIPFVIESSRGKGITKNISEISVACFEWMAILLVPFGKKRGSLEGGDKDFTKNHVDRRAFEVMVICSGD